MLCAAKDCMQRWDGNVAIEYALLAALLVLAIPSALTQYGRSRNPVEVFEILYQALCLLGLHFRFKRFDRVR